MNTLIVTDMHDYMIYEYPDCNRYT